MKVWNKECSTCGSCSCYKADESGCGCGNLEIDFPWNFNPYQSIYEDCTFNKEITKEVIESFGFMLKSDENVVKIYSKNYYPSDSKERSYSIFTWNDDKNTIQIVDDYLEYEDNYTLFRGILNNKEELKFILTSLGII